MSIQDVDSPGCPALPGFYLYMLVCDGSVRFWIVSVGRVAGEGSDSKQKPQKGEIAAGKWPRDHRENRGNSC